MTEVRIWVKTDKPVYVGGDMMTGYVCIQCATPVLARNCVVRLKGYESVWWRERHVRHKHHQGRTEREEYHIDHSARNDFFKTALGIFQEAMIPAGNWAFPFSYQSGYEYTSKIQYTAKALINTAYGAVVALHKTKQHILVYERLDAAVKPVSLQKSATVRFLCCIPRGRNWIQAHFDSNAYMPGQTLQVVADVRNESEVDIRALKVKLFRCVTLNTGSARKEVVDEVTRSEFAGVVKGESVTRNLMLMLPPAVAPSCRSRLVECRYWVEVSCDIPWSPDLEVDLSVPVFAPQPIQWGSAGLPTDVQFKPLAPSAPPVA